MQTTSTTDTRQHLVFDSVLEDVPGGICVAVDDLVQTTVEKGTPVGKDVSGIFHVVKTAEAYENASSSATDIKVLKGHNFKVGNILTSGLLKQAHSITAITTTETAYDTITIGTTLGVAITDGDVLFEALAVANTDASAYKYTPFGLVGEAFDVTTGDNPLTQCVVRGTAKTSQCPPLHADIKASLSHIRFI